MLCLLPVSNFLWNTGTRKPWPLGDSSNRSPGWSSLLTSVFCFWCSTLPLSIMSSSICCDRKLFIDWSSSIPSAWSLALVVSCLICCAWLWTVAVSRLICCNWFSSFDVCISICRVRSVYFDFNPSICCDWSLTTPRRTSTWSWVASSPRRARSKWCSTCNSKWDLALLLGNCNAEIKSVKHSINVPQIRILKKVRDSCYVLRSWLCRFRNVSISFFFFWQPLHRGSTEEIYSLTWFFRLIGQFWLRKHSALYPVKNLFVMITLGKWNYVVESFWTAPSCIVTYYLGHTGH